MGRQHTFVSRFLFSDEDMFFQIVMFRACNDGLFLAVAAFHVLEPLMQGLGSEFSRV